MVKSLLKNLIIFGLAFYLVFGVLRPLLKDLMKPVERSPHIPREGASAEEMLRAETYGEVLSEVKNFAKTNPKVTADIVKEWIGKE